MTESHFSLTPYIDILYRHRLSALCSLVVGLALTGFAAWAIPNLYLSTTLVTVAPQEVPPQYVSPAVTTRIKDRLQGLSLQALSRTRLEQLITRYGLYPEFRAAGRPIDEIATYMRQHIKISIPEQNVGEANSGGSFVISFWYFNPALTQQVTAQLADAFIDEDLRQRTQQASATSHFLEDQLVAARTALAQKAKQVQAFKDSNAGSLPQDLDLNLKTLESLRTELQTSNDSITSLQGKRLQLEHVLAQDRQQRLTITSPSGEKSTASPEAALASMETQLTLLRAQYSDDYPDVAELKAQIKALKKELISPKSEDGVAASPLDREIQKELETIALSERGLHEHIAALKKAIANYEKRIAETPAHEQQLASLMRDYEVLSRTYHDLLDKRLSAQMSENLEQRQEGERFRILDPANLPKRPELPDKTVVMLAGSLLSIAVALTLPFILYFTDTSLKSPDELRSAYGVPVAATVPVIGELESPVVCIAELLRASALSCAVLAIGAVGVWVYATAIL